MAEQETVVPIDDNGMLSSLMADEPQTEQPTQEQAPEAPQPREDATGRLHGEGGRFVSKAPNADAAPLQQQPLEQPVPQTPAPEPTESAGMKQLREAFERAERRAEEARFSTLSLQQRLEQRERELAELRKPKQEPIDPYTDFDGAINQRVQPVQTAAEQQLSELRLDMSRELAVIKHGEQAVSDMENAVAQAMQQGHPDMQALRAQMQASKFPALVAMQWHQREKTQREIGGDLNAYNAKLQEKLLADPEFRAKAMAAWTGQAQAAAAQPGARPNIELPPSINRATGAGLNNSDPTEPADMTDRGLFRYAMAKK